MNKEFKNPRKCINLPVHAFMHVYLPVPHFNRDVGVDLYKWGVVKTKRIM